MRASQSILSFSNILISRFTLIVLIFNTTGCSHPQPIEGSKGANKGASSVADKSTSSHFEKWSNRKHYPTLSPEIMKSISDADLEQVIIDYIMEVKIKNDWNHEHEI